MGSGRTSGVSSLLSAFWTGRGSTLWGPCRSVVSWGPENWQGPGPWEVGVLHDRWREVTASRHRYRLQPHDQGEADHREEP